MTMISMMSQDALDIFIYKHTVGTSAYDVFPLQALYISGYRDTSLLDMRKFYPCHMQCIYDDDLNVDSINMMHYKLCLYLLDPHYVACI